MLGQVIVRCGARSLLKSTVGTRTMPNMKHLIAGLLMAGALAMPAFADDRGPMQGLVTVFTKSGMTQMMVASTKVLDESVKDAVVLEDHAMVISHNGKMYLVKDHKLSSGKMVSELFAEEQGGKGGMSR
jgi:hypothetical protein